MKIAIYGKGGIGKSTIASNISAVLAKKGNKVLQVGCDPKHDSTILLSTESNDTLLNQLLSNKSMLLDDVVKKGIYDIDCIEIGGPEPGVGCAGRGVLKGIEVLKAISLDFDKYDLVTYDILGDVVCGGFFSPLTQGGLVDELYIVTSGEFNSLYAANNIVKGYLNCKLYNKNVRLAGIIGNLRNVKNEREIIETFCKAINVKLIACVDRDEIIEHSTMEGIPLIDYDSKSKATKQIKDISEYILLNDKTQSDAKCLTLKELRELYKIKRY